MYEEAILLIRCKNSIYAPASLFVLGQRRGVIGQFSTIQPSSIGRWPRATGRKKLEELLPNNRSIQALQDLSPISQLRSFLPEKANDNLEMLSHLRRPL